MTAIFELKATIRDYLGIDSSSAYADKVDLAIDLAESRFNAELRTRNQLTTAVLTLDENGEADLPTDYVGFYRAVAAEAVKVDLSEVSAEWMDSHFSVDRSGTAQYITVEGNTVRVRPLTSATINFIYYAAIPALSDENAQNWLLAKLPGLYLAASLYEAAAFFADQNDMQRFATMMADQKKLLEGTDIAERVFTRSLRIKGATP